MKNMLNYTRFINSRNEIGELGKYRKILEESNLSDDRHILDCTACCMNLNVKDIIIIMALGYKEVYSAQDFEKCINIHKLRRGVQVTFLCCPGYCAEIVGYSSDSDIYFLRKIEDYNKCSVRCNQANSSFG